VRVAGYSDYFNDLGEDLQNEIINRTEHEEV
jgi:formate C-acetyltransferase